MGQHVSTNIMLARAYPITGDKDAATTTTAVDDDEQETCGFCRFMKAGGCRQAFIVSTFIVYAQHAP